MSYHNEKLKQLIKYAKTLADFSNNYPNDIVAKQVAEAAQADVDAFKKNKENTHVRVY